MEAIAIMQDLGFTNDEMGVVRGSIAPNIAPLLNDEHLKAIQWLIRGRGHGAINARAGSGKTWFGVNCAIPIMEYLGTKSIGYVCFAKRNQLELAEKIKANGSSAIARTIDSLAWGAVWVRHKNTMNKDNDENKYAKLVRECIKRLDTEFGASDRIVADVEGDDLDLFTPAVKLIDLVRSQLREPTNEAMESLANWFDVELPGTDITDQLCFDIVRKCLNTGYEQIPFAWDFQDLRWKVCKEGYRPKQFNKMVVDECQDLSPDKLRIVQLALSRGGRILFVGDPEQAIMGFAGADHRSFESIVEKFETDMMTLSICWRCPTKVLDLAREIVPDIRNAPNAIEGEIKDIAFDKLVSAVKEGDMILCRVNADLISLCFTFIAEGINAKVIGRDIGKGLILTAGKISKARGFSWLKFDDGVDAWKDAAIAKIMRKNGGDAQDVRVQNVRDKARCLEIIWERGKCRTLKQFEKEVNSIFSDDRPGVALSSVHRAKGLEADHVYILREDLLPGPWARPGSWQHKQEENLHYVAFTRPKLSLTFIR